MYGASYIHAPTSYGIPRGAMAVSATNHLRGSSGRAQERNRSRAGAGRGRAQGGHGGRGSSGRRRNGRRGCGSDDEWVSSDEEDCSESDDGPSGGGLSHTDIHRILIAGGDAEAAVYREQLPERRAADSRTDETTASTTIHHISAEPSYTLWSAEELRLRDYKSQAAHAASKSAQQLRVDRCSTIDNSSPRSTPTVINTGHVNAGEVLIHISSRPECALWSADELRLRDYNSRLADQLRVDRYMSSRAYAVGAQWPTAIAATGHGKLNGTAVDREPAQQSPRPAGTGADAGGEPACAAPDIDIIAAGLGWDPEWEKDL